VGPAIPSLVSHGMDHALRRPEDLLFTNPDLSIFARPSIDSCVAMNDGQGDASVSQVSCCKNVSTIGDRVRTSGGILTRHDRD
jgi:hypothetical protein